MLLMENTKRQPDRLSFSYVRKYLQLSPTEIVG